MLLEREKASPANSANITSGEQQQQSRRGANKASELDRDPSTPSVVGIADSSGICGGSTVKENGSASSKCLVGDCCAWSTVTAEFIIAFCSL